LVCGTTQARSCCRCGLSISSQMAKLCSASTEPQRSRVRTKSTLTFVLAASRGGSHCDKLRPQAARLRRNGPREATLDRCQGRCECPRPQAQLFPISRPCRQGRSRWRGSLPNLPQGGEVVSADIGPGDWVECVQDTDAVSRGSVCQVTELPPVPHEVQGCDACAHSGFALRVKGVQYSNGPFVRPGDNDLFAHCSCFFRPIYRPKADLIEGLKNADVLSPTQARHEHARGRRELTR